MDETTKRCGTCRIYKARSEFYKSTKSPSGLVNNCKDCDRERLRQRRRSLGVLPKKQHLENLKKQKAERQAEREAIKLARAAKGTKFDQRAEERGIKYAKRAAARGTEYAEQQELNDSMRLLGRQPDSIGYSYFYRIESTYGLTELELKALFNEQDSKCAICAEPITFPDGDSRVDFHVDHCHKSGKVRGLLCPNCNHGLGKFRDDPQRLINACAYLARNQ